MFDFMNMMDNYKDRKVANYSKEGLTIDTCAVSDSSKAYETAVEHPLYNNGRWVVVELYDTKKEAKAGHSKWVKIMTKKKLPTSLKDVSTANITKLVDAVDTKWRVRKKSKEA